MKVATALVSGIQPATTLAEAAVRKAMQRAGLTQASSVLLFMSRDMAHFAKPSVTAAARLTSCLQVHGCTAYGVFTEEGWALDQSSVAALVMDHPLSQPEEADITLSLTGNNNLPPHWQSDRQRFGLLDSNATVWANARLSEQKQASIPLSGLRPVQNIVSGLKPLSDPLIVDASAGYDIQTIAGKPAIESLLRSLAPEIRERPPLYRLVAIRHPGGPGIPILSINADGSLTLGESLQPGDSLTWCTRQTLLAEKFMQEAMTAAVNTLPRPDFALMFSCIGRGPLFYGGDDLDLAAVRTAYPDLPLIGAYGSGQIAAPGNTNLLYQNTAINLLLEAKHV